MTNMDNDQIAVAVEALKSRASQRAAAAQKGAQRLAELKQTGKDVRSGALALVLELAAAQTLTDLAADLESGTLRIIPEHQVADPDDPGPEDPDADRRPEPGGDPAPEPVVDPGAGPVSDEDAAQVLADLTTADD